jgi:GcrA cell cycle regulator
MMRGPSSWTDERVATLKKLWSDGLSASRIASELSGTTRNAVLGKKDRLGLGSRRFQRKEGRPHLAPSMERRTSTNGNGVFAAIQRGAAPPLPELPAAQSSKPVKLLDLKDHHCRYPLNEPSYEMLHCGDPAVNGSYCSRHARIAYSPRRGVVLRPMWFKSRTRAVAI